MDNAPECLTDERGLDEQDRKLDEDWTNEGNRISRPTAAESAICPIPLAD